MIELEFTGAGLPFPGDRHLRLPRQVVPPFTFVRLLIGFVTGGLALDLATFRFQVPIGLSGPDIPMAVTAAPKRLPGRHCLNQPGGDHITHAVGKSGPANAPGLAVHGVIIPPW